MNQVLELELDEYIESLSDPKVVPAQDTVPDDTEISFRVMPPGGDEVVELIGMRANGDFYYKGKLIANDLEVFCAFREFLLASGHLKRPAEAKETDSGAL
jgi:hypothetical protein